MNIFEVKEKTGRAIQQRIDDATAAGGGRVELLPGIYESGTLYLKSNVELHIPSGTTLRGYTDPALYDDFSRPEFENIRPEGSEKCFIAAYGAENVSITGGGKIDGMGPAFYDTNIPDGEVFFRKPPKPRPRMIQFCNCRGVKFTDVSFINSPGWTMWLRMCEDVHFSRIKVEGDQRMINNDGIDIDSCRRVTLSDCTLKTGDDCLVLRAIKNMDNEIPVCEDICVTNCILNSMCQGIRIGCPSDATIRRATFVNIVFHGCGSGIHFNYPVNYLRDGDTGFLDVSDLVFKGFVIETEKWPVRFDIDPGIKLRRVAGIIFSDFRIRSKFPFSLCGNSLTRLKEITLNDISGETTASSPLEMLFTENTVINGFRMSVVIPVEPEKLERKTGCSWEQKIAYHQNVKNTE